MIFLGPELGVRVVGIVSSKSKDDLATAATYSHFHQLGFGFNGNMMSGPNRTTL